MDDALKKVIMVVVVLIAVGVVLMALKIALGLAKILLPFAIIGGLGYFVYYKYFKK